MSNVSQLSVGEAHACAVSDRGAALCWGWNAEGQLGDGTTTNRYSPVTVTGLGSGVLQVSAGREHSCALLDTGAVVCWGRNFLGQLGDGSQTNRLTPVAVSGLSSGVVEVAVNGQHSCARMGDGTLRCWGANGYGQLGNGNLDNQYQPVAVTGLSAVVSVELGALHSCALRQNGQIYCWGVYNRSCNNFGCAFDANVFPALVSGLGGAAQALTVGFYHNCALVNAAVKCWGDNYSGQLGNPDQPEPNPFTVFEFQGLESDVEQISAGHHHSCALKGDGSAWCWGRNSHGVLGDGSSDYRYPPVAVQHSPAFEQVLAGGDVSCALSDTGGVYCWGANDVGQLGDGSRQDRTSPVTVSALGPDVLQLEAGADHSCALTQAGAVRCWGSNRFGQLGIGRRDNRLPAAVVIDDVIFRSRFEAGG